MIAYQLRFPNNAAWNGKFTGENKEYFVIRRYSGILKAKTENMIRSGDTYHLYDFGDGWTASVAMTRVDSKEANKLRKNSAGFMGYEWMIREIEDHGRILTRAERKGE